MKPRPTLLEIFHETQDATRNRITRDAITYWRTAALQRSQLVPRHLLSARESRLLSATVNRYLARLPELQGQQLSLLRRALVTLRLVVLVARVRFLRLRIQLRRTD